MDARRALEARAAQEAAAARERSEAEARQAEAERLAALKQEELRAALLAVCQRFLTLQLTALARRKSPNGTGGRSKAGSASRRGAGGP